MSEVVKARQCFQEREWIEIFKARKACGKTVTQFCKIVSNDVRNFSSRQRSGSFRLLEAAGQTMKIY